MNDNSVYAIIFYVLLCCMLGVMLANKVQNKKPNAIDVYQGKTTLEHKVKDGEIIDSVVVFKNK